MTLAAQGLSFALRETEILRDVSVDFRPGEVSTIVGPNGAGKTTLLRLLSGELNPDRGTVTYAGCSITDIGLIERAQMRAVMTQSSQIVFDFTVEEVLLMGWVGRMSRQMKPLLDGLVTRCQIGDLLPRVFNTLSGGEQQRVQFARALLQLSPREAQGDARYLMLDEPTSSLDVAYELTVLALAREVATTGVAVVVVLHDLNLASRFADHVVLLRDGEVVADGPPTDVLQAQTLSDVYTTPMRVEYHNELERLVVFS